jgi:hypothetical protein
MGRLNNAVPENLRFTIEERLNFVSESIKETEEYLKPIWFEVELGPIKWARDANKRFRIMHGDRPLIERKSDIRIQCFEYLDDLVIKAERLAMEKLENVGNQMESRGNK